jgi:hypothetical protein
VGLPQDQSSAALKTSRLEVFFSFRASATFTCRHLTGMQPFDRVTLDHARFTSHSKLRGFCASSGTPASAMAILRIGSVAGTLDIAENLIFNAFRHITPTVVFQCIASGLMGARRLTRACLGCARSRGALRDRAQLDGHLLRGELSVLISDRPAGRFGFAVRPGRLSIYERGCRAALARSTCNSCKDARVTRQQPARCHVLHRPYHLAPRAQRSNARRA